MIPEIDIWRAAELMLKRYGDQAALKESAARADELEARRQRRVRNDPPTPDALDQIVLADDDLTVYNLYLRAYAMVSSSARQISEALRLAEQAIARDPRYRPALADVWARLTLRHAA